MVKPNGKWFNQQRRCKNLKSGRHFYESTFIEVVMVDFRCRFSQLFDSAVGSLTIHDRMLGWRLMKQSVRCLIFVLRGWRIPFKFSNIMTLNSVVSPVLGLDNCRRSSWFFNVPLVQVSVLHVRDGNYGLTSLSEKTRMSNHLQIFRAKAAHSPRLF